MRQDESSDKWTDEFRANGGATVSIYYWRAVEGRDKVGDRISTLGYVRWDKWGVMGKTHRPRAKAASFFRVHLRLEKDITGVHAVKIHDLIIALETCEMGEVSGR